MTTLDGYIIQKMRYSPAWYRCVARDEHGNKLTSKQIAERGGLSRTQVDRIAAHGQVEDWALVPIGTADKYCYGCRINPFRLRRDVQYAKRVRYSTNPRIVRGRNAAYFRRLNKTIGAKAQAKAKAALVEKAG